RILDLTTHSLDRFDAFVAGVASATGLSILYRRTGTLDVALREETLQRFRTAVETLAERGVRAELVDARGARSHEPHLTAEVLGALVIEAHGFVGAGELTQALVAAARHHGAQLTEPARVRRVRPLHNDLVVETERGALTAKAVVLAAGSWSSQIEVEGAAPAPVRPVRGQLLHLGWVGPPLARVTW